MQGIINQPEEKKIYEKKINNEIKLHFSAINDSVEWEGGTVCPAFPLPSTVFEFSIRKYFK